MKSGLWSPGDTSGTKTLYKEMVNLTDAVVFYSKIFQLQMEFPSKNNFEIFNLKIFPLPCHLPKNALYVFS